MSLAYHYSLIYNDLKDSIENFSLNSSQVKLALKTSLSCVTAIFLANVFKLNMPFWSGITTLVIMRANVGASFSKGWMRTGGCTIGCILCVFFMRYVVQEPLLFSVFLFLGIFFAFYTGVRAKYGYFWSYMLSNMALIGMVAISNPYDSFPLHIAFYRSTEIFLGVIVSWIYNIILWPNYAGNKFDDALNSLISELLLFHSKIVEFYISQEKNPNKLIENYNDIKLMLKNCRGMLNDVDSERFLLRKDKTDNRAILNLIENRTMSLDNIIAHFSENCEYEFPVEYNDFFRNISKSMYKLSCVGGFRNKNFLKNIPDEQTLRLEIINRYNTESFRKHKADNILFFYEIMYYLEAFCKDLKRISCDNIIRYSNRILKNDSDYLTLKVFNINFDLYKPSLKNAIKGGIAVLGIFWICLWLQIPGGYANMTVAIIAVLGPQLDTLTSKHKGILRFFGCLTGAALGLSFLLLNIDSTYIYFIIIFCVTSVTSYIFAAKQGVSYIGLQAGLAFLICIADGFGPVTSIDSVIERLTGIFLAVLLMWSINYVIWPEDMLSVLKTKLKFALKSLKEQAVDLQLKDDRVYENILPEINIDDIYSILKTLKETEELPDEFINKLKNYIMNLNKISKKIHVIANTKKKVLSFFDSNYNGVLAELYYIIDLAIEESLDNKGEIKTEQIINDLLKKLDYIIKDIRKKGTLRSKEINFKQDVACFILMLRRILYDAEYLSEIDINSSILDIK